MREALLTWMRRRGWEAAAAACQQQCCEEQAATCAAVMATGQVPEVAVPQAYERIAVRT